METRIPWQLERERHSSVFDVCSRVQRNMEPTLYSTSPLILFPTSGMRRFPSRRRMRSGLLGDLARTSQSVLTHTSSIPQFTSEISTSDCDSATSEMNRSWNPSTLQSDSL